MVERARRRGSERLAIRTLDHEIAAAARDEWGGVITERVDKGTISYKYTATGTEAKKAIADVTPYLMGPKRERAEELLAGAAA